MDSYVRNATGGTDPVVGVVTKDKSEQQPPKRKWEDSGGESESVAVEKKSRKSVPGSNNPLQNKANTTGNHLESVNDQKENVIRHDTFCWSCHSDAAPVRIFDLFLFLGIALVSHFCRLCSVAIVHGFSISVAFSFNPLSRPNGFAPNASQCVTQRSRTGRLP